MGWKDDAVRMRLDEGLSWREIAERLQGSFPGKDLHQIQDAVRRDVRRSERWKAEMGKAKTESNEKQPEPEFIPKSRWKDGIYERERLIEMNDEDEKSPRRMLELHGLDPDEWDVVDCVNNYWNAQVHHSRVSADGKKLEMRQSKLRAKPKLKTLTFADVEQWFDAHSFENYMPLTVPLQYDPAGEILEIDLPDLHNGMLAWGKETGASYDLKIAKERFAYCMCDIAARCAGRKFSKIIFATLGDLMHIDNDMQTTTKGTPQQADGRVAKIYDVTLDMLISGLKMLGAIAPVEVVYLPGNHDGITGYMLIKAVSAAFMADTKITFDVGPDPQKARMIGCTLLGLTHGNMPKKNRIGWIQVMARKMAQSIRFVEVHHGHEHTERKGEYVQTEDNEGVVDRGLPKICNSSHWEHQQGYVSTEAMMCFVWHETLGLRETWYNVL